MVDAVSNGTAARVEVWRALASSQITNQTITATLSAEAKATLIVSAFHDIDTSGVNGAGAIDSIATSTGSSVAPSVTLSAALESRTVSGLAAQGIPSISAGSSETLIATETTVGGAASDRVSGASSYLTTVTHSTGNTDVEYALGSSSAWALIGIELKRPE